MRSAVLNILGPGWLDGRTVQDLCCGSGALGMECLGSGAAHVTFVDSSPKAIAFIRDTLASFGATSGFDLLCRDVRSLDSMDLPPPDLVFMDPPYGDSVLYSWARSRDWSGTVAGGGYVFLEAGPEEVFFDWQRRAYGGSTLFWQHVT